MAFDYTAPADCPGADDFAALVTEHTGGAWTLRRSAGERGLSVEIVPDPEGKRGRLRRKADATTPATAPREVTAVDCKDVARALALTVALSLGEETPSSPRSTAVEPVTPPRAIFELGVGFPASAIVPPYPMVGISLFVERGRRSWPAGWFFHRPDLRFTVSHVRNDLLGQAGKARFDLTTGAGLACPLGISSLRLCAGVEAGWLNGRGRAIAAPQSDRSFWVATGGLAQGRLALGTVGFLEASVGVWVPWRRAGFVFESPQQPVAKVPALFAAGGVALGFPIP